MKLTELCQLVKNHPQTKAIASAVLLPKTHTQTRSRWPVVGGVGGGKTALLFAALYGQIGDFVFIVTPTILSAEQMYNDLCNFLPDSAIEILPRLDALPHELTAPSIDLQGKRIQTLTRVLNGEIKILIAPIKAIMFRLLEKKLLGGQGIRLEKDAKVNLDELSQSLVGLGFRRVSLVGEKGEFAIRGGIIDVYASTDDCPVRVELDGDQIISLRTFEVSTQRSIASLPKYKILPAQENVFRLSSEATLVVQGKGVNGGGGGSSSIAEYLPNGGAVLASDKAEIERAIEDLFTEVKEAENFDKKNYRQQLAFTSYDEFENIFTGHKGLHCFPWMAPASLSFFPVGRLPVFSHLTSLPAALLKEQTERKDPTIDTLVVTRHAATLTNLFADEGIAAEICPGKLSSGFNLDDLKWLVLSDYEIFGEKVTRAPHEIASAKGIDPHHVIDLKIGDYVVHEDYGIGQYMGMEVLEETGSKQEFLALSYFGGDQLHVPASSIGKITKYSARDELVPRLDHLGSKQWQNTKARARKKIREMTKELLALYAERTARDGFSFAGDDLWQKELELSFPYEETADQTKVIAEVKKDMELPRPMDRLVLGDVGFGKTEVAIRAAVKAVSSGKQVAVLVPTTILAEQHYSTFSSRLKPFPIKIKMLSRFVDKKQQVTIAQDLKLGKIDILVGTARLLSQDIHFADLGLLIIDEEQRFGVLHKEKIKLLKKTIDVLTLSATPLPRTLHLSLSGARDLSLLNTPPADRSPVCTYVLEWNDTVVREAILREIERGGQIFFVHNAVQTIGNLAVQLKKLIPGIRVVVAHGQMHSALLEKNVMDFFQQKYDVLLCTTIIESGIDMPNVNTIIISNAERMGLAQLYQLRGRVGRSSTRAYAYLFCQKYAVESEAAMQRLRAIEEFTRLGSGYKLALRDLEIRGGGNILGTEQSGHLAAVGFDLYCQLVEEEVAKLKGVFVPPPRSIVLDIKIDALIPANYVAAEAERIALYRRMNLLETAAAVDQMGEEMKDRYGTLPAAVKLLQKLLRLKIAARNFDVVSIRGDETRVTIDFGDIPNRPLVARALAAFKGQGKFARQKFIIDVHKLPASEWIGRLQNVFSSTA